MGTGDLRMPRVPYLRRKTRTPHTCTCRSSLYQVPILICTKEKAQQSTVQQRTARHSTAPHRTAGHGRARHSTAPRGRVRYRTAPHGAAELRVAPLNVLFMWFYVRTYIIPWYLVLSYDNRLVPRMYERESTAQHGTEFLWFYHIYVHTLIPDN